VIRHNDIPVQIQMGDLTDRNDLRISHEEADVIIIQQMVHLMLRGANPIQVICDDTDVVILLVHFYFTLQLICSETTFGSITIHIKATSEKHAHAASPLLHAHAFTGCDIIQYLFGIGKGTAIKTLKAGKKLEYIGKLDVNVVDVLDEATSFITSTTKDEEENCFLCHG